MIYGISYVCIVLRGLPDLERKACSDPEGILNLLMTRTKPGAASRARHPINERARLAKRRHPNNCINPMSGGLGWLLTQ